MSDLLKAAVSALRSYQYGNSDPTLAKEVADKIESVRAEVAAPSETDLRLLWAACHHEDAFLAYAESTNSDTFGLPYGSEVPLDQTLKFLRERIDEFRSSGPESR